MATILGIGPRAVWPPIDFVLATAEVVALGISATLAHALLMPTTATLALMSDGRIVEVGRPRYAFRWGYPWTDIRLEGGRLMLPPIRRPSPESLRMTANQLARIAPGSLRVGPDSDSIWREDR